VEEILMGDIFTIGIDENEKQELTIYPNPTSQGFVTIGGIDLNDVEEYFIMDMSGKIVSHQNKFIWFDGKVALPPAKGTYIISVRTSKGRLNATIVNL
jgi:hypothetical protein